MERVRALYLDVGAGGLVEPGGEMGTWVLLTVVATAAVIALKFVLSQPKRLMHFDAHGPTPPDKTKEEILQRVRSLWPSQVDLAMSELDLYAGPEHERERVQWDALTLSKGSLEHLRRWIRNYDYRDVITAAEYGNDEVLRTFDEQTNWRPDDEKEISFRDL
jgi:hypothetical protein